MGGSLGSVELMIIFLTVVGIPIAIIVLLLKRRDSSDSATSPNTVSIKELQEATSQTLQDKLVPLENKIDSLSERIGDIESRLAD